MTDVPRGDKGPVESIDSAGLFFNHEVSSQMAEAFLQAMAPDRQIREDSPPEQKAQIPLMPVQAKVYSERLW